MASVNPGYWVISFSARTATKPQQAMFGDRYLPDICHRTSPACHEQKDSWMLGMIWN